MALVLGVVVLAAASGPSFINLASYATAKGPISVAIGDLNGDGKPDLVTANGSSDSVSVLLNRGDGTYLPRINYETARGPYSVAVGDLNGDGKADLVTANAVRGGVSVLLNEGDGSFRARHDYRVGSDPQYVAIGDLNGDGKPDLAVPSGGLNGTFSITVFTNKGDGTFQARVDYRTGGELDKTAIGDLNGDGKPDLVTTEADRVSVLLNSGHGTFAAARDYDNGLSGAAGSVALGDLNGDGTPDLVTVNSGGDTVSVLLNKGDGTFQRRLDYPTGGHVSYPTSVAIGDLNGDGKPDLAAANFGSNTVAVMLANTASVCTVPNVAGKTLATATQTITRALCRVGRIRSSTSPKVAKGRVIWQTPDAPTVLPKGGRIDLGISRGRK